MSTTKQKFVLHPDQTRAGIVANAHAFIERLPADKTWLVTIERFVKKRTNDQNAALWGVAYPALQAATGQGVNDWHEYMLGEAFGWIESDLFGKRKVRPARTTTTGYDGEPSELSTIEFANFYNFIQQRAAENGVFVADPDPMYARDKRR